MKRHPLAAIVLTAGLGFATAAAADCAAEIEALGLSKDGATAPLAGEATPQTGGMAPAADATAPDANKGGNAMPLGADPNLATSAEDAQAQSQGGETAAAQAMGDPGNAEAATGKEAAVAEARAALEAGDEEACMAAVARAKGR